MMPLYDHQMVTAKQIFLNPYTFCLNEAGTGKTRSWLEAFNWELQNSKSKVKQALIVAPLSILEPSWADDIAKFYPHMTVEIAHGRRKETALNSSANIILVNHDGVKWINKLTKDFTNWWICVDESTAFKNKDSLRSKSLAQLIQRNFTNKVLMTGTPNPNTVLDAWHQMKLLDNGVRLDRNIYVFRNKVCSPQWVPGVPKPVYKDKPGAEKQVMEWIKDCSVRFTAEECLDLPKNRIQKIFVKLPKKAIDAYRKLAREAYVQLESGVVTAVHAGALTKKLLQICTGSVYDSTHNAIMAHENRYSLVIDLVEQRTTPCVVAFNWRHEKEGLLKLAKKRGITTEFIDGSVAPSDRADVVRRFQHGHTKMLLCQPQSASHGLTLTTARTTIWASPTYNAEHYLQMNKRIHRVGQTAKTETILITAEETAEEQVYEKLNGKVERMESLLHLMADHTRREAA